jgi:uncharacterized protein
VRLATLSSLFALAALAAAPALALDISKLTPSGYVNDFAHALDPGGAAAINAYCANLEQKTGVQVAVVTVETLDGDLIDDVANKLFHQWGIGKKGTDEGLLILLAIRDRKQRAEVGYGLEPIIPDGFAGDVLRGIRPILRQGNYGGALLAAVQQFGTRIGAAKGVDLETGQPQVPQQPSVSRSLPWPLILVMVFVVLSMIGSRRGGGRWGGGGLLQGLILGSLLSGGRRGGGWGGGGGFGGDSGGGGFGGFGGGDSGGGGASSDW